MKMIIENLRKWRRCASSTKHIEWHAYLEGDLMNDTQSNDIPSVSSKDGRDCWKFKRFWDTIDPPLAPPSVSTPPSPPSYTRGCTKAQRCRISPPKHD